MNHEHFQELVNLYLDAGLDDNASAELFAHLGACNECRILMRSSLQVRSYYQNTEMEEVSASLDRRVLATARNKPARTTQRNPLAPLWATRILIPLPAAASIAVLILIGSLLFSPLLIKGTKPKNDVQIEMISKLPLELQQQLRLFQ
jgi:hypothetical protein